VSLNSALSLILAGPMNFCRHKNSLKVIIV
jgi:hypothetical protein